MAQNIFDGDERQNPFQGYDLEMVESLKILFITNGSIQNLCTTAEGYLTDYAAVQPPDNVIYLNRR